MKAVCSFQRPLYTSVIYGRTIAQHTRDAYCDLGSDIPVICVTWIDRHCVGVCCERSHSSDQRPGSIRCRKTGRGDKTASFWRSSLSSRAFSTAMTAWAAKFLTKSICFSVKGFERAAAQRTTGENRRGRKAKPASGAARHRPSRRNRTHEQVAALPAAPSG